MTAPLPTPSKTRAWVCAPGVLKVPFLSAFLPDYDLSALPGTQTEAVLGWGMKSTAAAVQAALPMKRRTIAGRMTRMCPWLEAPAEGEPIEAAAALLAAVSALRGAAVTFGCEADRAALKTEMTDYLSAWANEALDGVADGEVDDPDHALRLVGIAARFLTTIEALEAARAIRRRAATAETALLPQ